MSETYVVFLLDRTGSMGRMKPATIEGFNTYLASLKEQSGSEHIVFTLIQFFGRGVDTVYQRVPLDEVQPLNAYRFQPQGRTPLVDAAYKTIAAVERTMAQVNQPEAPPGSSASADTPNIVICIQSDGDDNASVEYDWADLRQLIAEKTAQGWKMLFMGAGIDAETQAEWMSLLPEHTLSYSMDTEATRQVFTFAAERTASFALVAATRPGASDNQMAPDGSVLHQPATTKKQKIPDDIAV